MAKRKAGAAVTLPEEKSAPSSELSDYSMLWYGQEKIGKTTLAAEFPDALFLMFEPGGKALSLYQIAITRWEQMIEALDLLEKTDRFGTVIIDTVDLAYELCMRYACAEMGIEHPGDEDDYGASWGRVKSAFVLQLQRLVSGPRGVIFISHATEREIKGRSGVKAMRTVPTMSGQARSVIEPVVDVWAFYEYQEKGKRVLHIVGDDVIGAGHRLEEHFVGISAIDMGDSPKAAFENFMAAFRTRNATFEDSDGATKLPGGESTATEPEDKPRRVRRRRKSG